MVKLTQVLGLMGVPLALAACTQTAGGPPPGMTAAQGAAYCTKLTTVYSEYVAGLSTSMGGVGRGGGQSDIDARVAVAQCQEGNTAAGIPVLQRELRNNKVEVPPP
ncbi:hypothetical protein [Reyranella sp.]|uniref:hypothetical protein n=1 Tax=Reyranella sp. TaxID=1929291 RepID=UPI003D11F3CB